MTWNLVEDTASNTAFQLRDYRIMWLQKIHADHALSKQHA